LGNVQRIFRKIRSTFEDARNAFTPATDTAASTRGNRHQEHLLCVVEPMEGGAPRRNAQGLAELALHFKLHAALHPQKQGTRELPREFLNTTFNFLTVLSYANHGLGCGVGRGRGVGVALGVAVGVGVTVGVTVCVTVGVAVGVTVGVGVGVAPQVPPVCRS